MKSDLRLVFADREAVRCVFHTVVVKVSSIVKKYPGGLRNFVNTHGAFCNRDIAVVCAMAPSDLSELLDDLAQNEIKPRTEATYFDASRDAMFLENGTKAEIGIKWLQGRLQDGGTMVRYIDTKRGQRRAKK